MSRQTYVWCREKKAVVPKGEEARPHRAGYDIMGPLDPFVSPITGEIITNRPQLAAHNRQHGVTNAADYSKEWHAEKSKERHLRATGQDAQATAERKEILKDLIIRR